MNKARTFHSNGAATYYYLKLSPDEWAVVNTAISYMVEVGSLELIKEWAVQHGVITPEQRHIGFRFIVECLKRGW